MTETTRCQAVNPLMHGNRVFLLTFHCVVFFDYFLLASHGIVCYDAPPLYIYHIKQLRNNSSTICLLVNIKLYTTESNLVDTSCAELPLFE